MKYLPATLLLLSVVVKAADTNTLPALVPAYGEIPPTFWELHGTLILVASFGLVLLAALAAWKMLQPKPTVILPPEIIACDALTKLLGQPEDGKLLSAVSQILRRYLIAAFEFPRAESTTAEFCTALAAHEKIGGELARSISDFLRECDQRKFSSSPAAVPLNAATRAVELVGLAEKRRAQIFAAK